MTGTNSQTDPPAHSQTDAQLRSTPMPMPRPATAPDAALAARLADAVREQAPGVRTDLEALVRIPSVSAPAFDPAPVGASAQAVADLLRAEEMTVEVIAAGGHPAVLAHVDGPPGSPRVLLYAHHDVQPAGREADWRTPPFEPTQDGRRLYGRGTADDKAGVMAHVAAIRAHRRVQGGPPVSVTIIVEGEEESGSATLPALLQRYRDRLDCDAIVLADSTNWAVGTPALTTTLRGCIRVEVTVKALQHGIHSGMYGGPVPDALTAMCRLLATLHEPDGSVAITGLRAWDDAGLDYPVQDFRRDAGLLDGVDLLGTGTIVSRLWTAPSVTVTGIDAPTVAEAVNVLQASCRAQVSIRTAPPEDPEHALELVTTHLRSHAPWGVQVEVEPVDLGSGYMATADGPYMQAARAAFADAWGRPPVDIGVGGSIPFVAQFAELFPQAAILITGVEDPDSRAHGANESLHLDEFGNVCLAEAMLLERIGALR